MMVIAIITPLWYVWKWWFDWTKQITPWQFLPPKSGTQGVLQPVQYATKLMHL